MPATNLPLEDKSISTGFLEARGYVGTVYIGNLKKPMPVDQYQWDWLKEYYLEHL